MAVLSGQKRLVLIRRSTNEMPKGRTVAGQTVDALATKETSARQFDMWRLQNFIIGLPAIMKEN
jgi:hypothetical protein